MMIVVIIKAAITDDTLELYTPIKKAKYDREKITTSIFKTAE